MGATRTKIRSSRGKNFAARDFDRLVLQKPDAPADVVIVNDPRQTPAEHNRQFGRGELAIVTQKHLSGRIALAIDRRPVGIVV